MGDANRGRVMLLAILGSVIGLDLLSTVVTTIFMGGLGSSPARGAIRLILTAGLAWAVFAGKSWAKWTLGILLLLGAAAGVWSVMALGALLGTGVWTIWLSAMALVNGIAGVLLLVSRDIQSYLDSHDTIVMP